jgi:hypothetical protein
VRWKSNGQSWYTEARGKKVPIMIAFISGQEGMIWEAENQKRCSTVQRYPGMGGDEGDQEGKETPLSLCRGTLIREI